MSEKTDAIKDWLDGEGDWSLGKSSKLDKDRLQFRQNLLILLDKYVNHTQTSEEKELKLQENEILKDQRYNLFYQNGYILQGYLTDYENNELIQKYILNFSENPLKVEFLISKDEANEILKTKDIPGSIEPKPKLREPTVTDIENATKVIKDKTKVDYRVKVNGKLYNARRLYLISLALANSIEDTYISPSYGGKDKKTLTNMNYKFYNKKGEEVDINKNENEAIGITYVVELLKYQKQIILQGPPGTGKTRVAKQIAIAMLKEKDISLKDEPDFTQLTPDLKERVKLIQFHPSYSYEDFVRGIVAKTEDGKDGIRYVVENKILAQIAKDALEDKESKPYILIVDEINRANLSSVLGELIYALEYRDEAVESMYELEDENQKKTREIILPSNLYIIGTMNTADRSIGSMDYAIRRRFAFVDVLPDSGVVSPRSKFDDVQKIFDDCTSIDFEKKKVRLGHSYFIAKDDDITVLNNKLKYQVIPLLEEYVSDGVLTDSAKNYIDKLKSATDSDK